MTTEYIDRLKDLAKCLGIPPNDFIEAIEEMNMTKTNVRGPSAGSFNTQVIELNPGESVSKVRAVDPTIPISRLPDEMPAIRQQVRNACAPAVTRAKEATGGIYTVEVGDCLMFSGGFYVVAVVTRKE